MSEMCLSIADMHIESWPKMLAKYKGEADVVVAAGDIHTRTDGPAELRRIFGDLPIVYVAGNHEYYGSVYDEEDERLRKACRNQDIHFLQCDSVEIGDAVFLGCTLWTDFELYGAERKAEAESMVGRYLNDYRAIWSPEGRRPVTTQETLELHRQHKAWLQDQFELHKGKKLIVVTHHGPSFKCIHPQYKDDIVSAGFASNLDDLVAASNAKYWFCGHSHVAQNFTIGSTQVWQNCMGYHREQIEGFNPYLMLEL